MLQAMNDNGGFRRPVNARARNRSYRKSSIGEDVEMNSEFTTGDARQRSGTPFVNGFAPVLDPGKNHAPLSIVGWGGAIVGGLAIWTAVFLAL